jgi:hypothetical protein
MSKICHEPRADNWALGEQPKPRRQRKPRLDRAIAAAERAGKTVTSIVTQDGVTLNFGEPAPTEAVNPWLAELEGKARQ